MKVFCIFRLEDNEKVLEAIYMVKSDANEYIKRGELMTMDVLVCEEWNLR